jgi:signal peptidase I
MQTFDMRGHSPGVVRLKLAEELLHSFGELRVSALGSSMVPAIYPGDVLTIRRQGADAAECGDIVLSARGNRFFVHRVLRKSEFAEGVRLLTRGDALAEPDPPIAAGELLGRVTSIERGARKLAARPRLSRFEKCLQWGVRRSDAFLKLLLRAHSLRRRRYTSTFAGRAVVLRGSS